MSRRTIADRLPLLLVVAVSLGSAGSAAQEGTGDVPIGGELRDRSPGVPRSDLGSTDPGTCTYDTYQWSVEERRGVNHRSVSHSYADVTDEERDPNDPRCTVCREDQAAIDPSELGLDGLETFSVCRHYRDAVAQALRDIAASGEFDVEEISAYRPGQTRGAVVDGLRTEWSNHSFGTAIDINAGDNGLYNSCNVSEVTSESIEGCRLGVGGRWDPERRPRTSVVRGGAVYRAFTEGVGWRWGGEISGNIRDLMHFSLTGE